MRIIYTRPDGGVTVMAPADQAKLAKSTPEVEGMTELQFMEWVRDNFVPEDATNVQIVEDADVPPSPPVVPMVVSRRQGLRALYELGLTAQVEALINAIPGAEGDKARIDWREAQEIRRDHPLIDYAKANIPLTDSQVDQLFTLAASL